MSLRKHLVRAVQSGLRVGGFQLVRSGSDRCYLPTPPGNYLTYAPGQEPAFLSRFEPYSHHTLTTPDRALVLERMLTQTLGLEGDVVEAGVFRGGTAWWMADLLDRAGSSKTLHLFDSFEGMPADTLKDRDGHDPGDFGDTSLEAVQALLAHSDRVSFHPGFIPATLAPVSDRTYSFVHVDVDIHDAVRDCCSFFYERLVPGGVLLFDDYGFEIYRLAARKAVDDFFADKPESVLVLRTGQAIVTRLPKTASEPR